MHYDGTLGGRFESNPIMKDKRTGKSIGVNREMSSIDIQKLNEMYPCKAMEPVGGKLMNSQWPVRLPMDSSMDGFIKFWWMISIIVK